MANYRVNSFVVYVPSTEEEQEELKGYIADLRQVTAGRGFLLKTKIEVIRSQDFPKRGKVTRVDA